MAVPWKGIGLERVLAAADGGTSLFVQGRLSESECAPAEEAVRIAYVGDEKTVDLRLLARTLHPTLPGYGLSKLCSHYGIAEGRAPETFFSLFSLLIEGFLKLSPDLLALLAEILPPPNNDLIRRMIRFARPEEEAPTDERTPSTNPPQLSLTDLLAPEGPLARDLNGFEARSGQSEMAERVLNVLERGGTTVVEAGPGTGKTFAYLIPALIHLRDHEGVRVVLSTRTKQLQEQVFHKDLPFLSGHILPSLQVSLLKGRRNYICLRRWQIVLRELVEGLERDLLTCLAPVARWLLATQTGDIEENAAFLSDPQAKVLWRRMYDDPHRCLGQSCPFYDDCFSVAARRHARRADLVVVNHSLLLADQQTDQGILGDYQCLIVDEAHAMETAARQAFTITLSTHSVDSLLRAIEHPLGRRTGGWLARLPYARTDARIGKVHDLLNTLRGANTRLFSSIARGLPPGRGRSPDLSPFEDQMAEVVRELETLTRSIESLGDALEAPDLEREADGLIIEDVEIVAAFHKLFSPPDENSVHWYEFINEEPYLRISPLSVAPFLEKSLYPRVESLVLTSATLSQGGDFTYLEESLGLSEAPGEGEPAVVQGPFSYENEMKLLIPEFFPPVTSTDNAYVNALNECIQGIVSEVGRKILILFTSYKLLHAVHDALDEKALVLAQAIDGPRSKLIERFKESEGSAVLLGTDSFWEGVDLPGDALEILIITRLPFPVPTDPVFSALADRIAELGKDPFSDLSIPRAILKLRQGVGRLIRTTSDHGVVIITDQRILRKSYGKRFTAALPVVGERVASLQELLSEVKTWLHPES